VQRNLIFFSSGVLFILIAGSLVAVGAGQNDTFMLITIAMAIPFLFIGYWNIYNVFYERRTGYSNEYFTSRTIASASVGAFYNKKIIVPVFLIMFGTAAFAIGSAFLAMNKNEEIAIALVAFSFTYALTLTIVFMLRLKKGKAL
jgi:hypothetical protein